MRIWKRRGLLAVAAAAASDAEDDNDDAVIDAVDVDDDDNDDEANEAFRSGPNSLITERAAAMVSATRKATSTVGRAAQNNSCKKSTKQVQNQIRFEDEHQQYRK